MPLSKFEREHVKSMVLLELNTAFVRVAQLYDRQQAAERKCFTLSRSKKTLRQALSDLGEKATLELG